MLFFWDQEVMKKTMKACIILHIMIVETQRDGYSSDLIKQGKEASSNEMFTTKIFVAELDIL